MSTESRGRGHSIRAVALVIVGLLASVGVSAQPPEPELLTLERAIALAQESNLDLAAVDARRVLVATTVAEASARRLPRVALDSGYQRTDNPVLVFGTKLLQGDFRARDFDLGRLNDPSSVGDFANRVSIEQPLWAGGRIAGGIEAAEAGLRATVAERERARQELVREVTDRYTGAVLATHALAAARASLESAGAHVRFARDLFESGLVVESDLLLARVRESEVEAAVVQAGMDVEIARAALNLSLGRDQATRFELPEDLAPMPPIGSTLDQLVERARERRPDLEAARSRSAAAVGLQRAIRGGTRPEIGLVAGLESHAADLLGVDASNATIGVGLRFALFDPGRRARMDRADAERELANLAVRRSIEHAELEVRRTLAAFGAAEQRLALAERGLELSTRSLAIVEDRYRNGLTTVVDLLAAESALTDSRVRELAARRDVLLARVDLDLATGAL